MIRGVINEFSGMRTLLSSSRPKGESLSFILAAICRFFFPKKSISYLGDKFYYLDKNTPLLLQWYPQEIESILKRTGRIRSCLDIGANVGQFAYTLKKYLPEIKIVSIEPQEGAIPILHKNVAQNTVISACVGKGDYKTLYVEEGKTDRSSPIVGANRGANKALRVKAIELTKRVCQKLKIDFYYDLIKIDVEGGEKEVLQCIKDLEWKFLQVETTEKELAAVEKIISAQWPGASKIYGAHVTPHSGPLNFLFRRS